ncbi:Crp/Fnr family transcriptional regulator [Tepidibacter hydrothermalis]|uniref:Crp/Fnr family transcriptional regulator n=1 Tax=Tepidibacter hydrothermalis TaxID=3036126 RepID=A0ABY8EI73_9FIRM|nr:Crp/Fnr family transcriptional regulator [Tepidibacter hydrothermalis]WFD11292.1 Crp/Fnr family transcriptional regulator [Tepidibacter hydrothermalis]
MYEKIFDQEIQKEMDSFFINNLSGYGKIETLRKGHVINQKNQDNIYIILEGEFNQIMYSKNGDEIIFFRMTAGDIFGETDFFDNSRTFVIYKAIKNAKVSILNREILEAKLMEFPNMYNYFLKSIIRKQRMIMIELSNFKFNDSIGKLADFLVRLYYTEDININFKNHISIVLTHEEIANRIGLNRTTVTNVLKIFKDRNLIEVKDRKLIIKDIQGLKNLTNIPLEE